MLERLNPFYKLLKTETSINNPSEFKQTFDSVKKALSDACELALKQPLPGKQLANLFEACFTSAGYDLILRIIRTKRSNQSGKSMRLWRSDLKSSPLHKSKYQSTRNFF